MRSPKTPRVILTYYLYQATATFGFFWPVFTVFLLNSGLNFTQITLLNSISAVFIVIGEVPTGYIGDRIGRRDSLIISSVLFSVSIFGFLVAQTFLEFVILWIVWSFATTFQSGSDDAWLYDTLKEQSEEHRYTHVRGRGGSVNMWVTAGTSFIAGVLYTIQPTLPFLAGGILLGLGVPVLLSLPRNPQHTDDTETFTVIDALPVLRKRLSEPPLRSFILYIALFLGITAVIDNFIQPIVVDAIGLSVTTLGPIYAGFSIMAAITSYYAGAIEDALTTRWAVAAIPLVTGFVLCLPLLVPAVALPAFFLMKSSRTVISPIASGYINTHTESVGRATILSAASMVYALVRVPLQPLGGVIADLTTPLRAVVILGGIFLTGAIIIHLWEAPINENTE
jgi:predicted MFS family arabinose efflux permease